MRLPLGRLFLLVALVLVACSGASPNASPSPSGTPSPSVTPSISADPSPSVDPSPSSSPSPSASPSASPSGQPTSAVAVVRIEEVGGMLPPSMTLNRYPTVVLYADGRLITLGPQIELYPGPALPNLQVTQLTERGVDQVLTWAADAGLQGEDRFLGQPMLDASQLTFTVVRPEGRHVTTVADLSAPDQPTGAVRQFQDVLLNIRQWLPDDVVGDDQPFAWDRLQILTAPADPATSPDPQLATVVDWPLASLATLGVEVDVGARCAMVEGADLDVLRPALATANELTLWRSGDVTYSVKLHPLLPDDVPCGVAAPG